MTIKTAHRGGLVHLIPPVYYLTFTLLIVSFGSACSPKTVHGTASGKAPHIERQLRQAARQWVTTPHRLGGLDRNGIDCSGLVKVLYKELFHVQLPRTTRQQVKQGVAVEKKRLQAGDLIFFRPPQKGGHVGIYLGKGQFLHTSARRGVMVSHLSEKYWRNSYWTARRVLLI